MNGNDNLQFAPPSPAVPSAQASASVPIPPAPDVSGLPAARPPEPVNPHDVARAQDMARHSLIGRAFSSIIGHETRSEYNAQSGQIDTVPVKQAPGTVFRSMLAGALLGLGMGTQPNEAGRERLQAQAQTHPIFQSRQQREAASLATAKSSQEDDQKQKLAAAGVAQSTISHLGVLQHVDMYSPEQVSAYNNSNEQVKSAALKAGGVLATIPGPAGNLNGKPGNGAQLMKLYSANPERVMQAGPGYHRVLLSSVDTSGLTHLPGGGWKDADGMPVDVNSRITNYLIDVPNSAFGQHLTLTKADVNAAAGFPIFPADQGQQTVSTTLGGIFSANVQSIQSLNEARAVLYPPIKNAEDYSSQRARVEQIVNDPTVSDQDRDAADKTLAYLDKFAKRFPELTAAVEAAKKEKPESAFPIFKNSEEAAGYKSSAQRVLSDPASSPTQKDQARKQISYAEQSIGLLRGTKTEEAAAEALAKGRAQREIDKDDEEVVAQSLAAGDATSLKDVASLRGDQRLRIYARAKVINPNFNTTQAKLKGETLEKFTNGKQADQIQSFNAFLGHAADASDVVNGYRTSGSPLMNRSLNWIRNNAAGDPSYTQFVAALTPVRDEYATFLRNNFAVPVEEQKLIDRILSDDSSPAQIQAALKQMAHTAIVRLDALNARYKTVMGENYPALISSDGVEAAGKLGLGKEAAKYGSGGLVTGAPQAPRNVAPGAPKPKSKWDKYPEAQ